MEVVRPGRAPPPDPLQNQTSEARVSYRAFLLSEASYSVIRTCLHHMYREAAKPKA